MAAKQTVCSQLEQKTHKLFCRLEVQTVWILKKNVL